MDRLREEMRSAAPGLRNSWERVLVGVLMALYSAPPEAAAFLPASPARAGAAQSFFSLSMAAKKATKKGTTAMKTGTTAKKAMKTGSTAKNAMKTDTTAKNAMKTGSTAKKAMKTDTTAKKAMKMRKPAPPSPIPSPISEVAWYFWWLDFLDSLEE